MSIQMSCRLTLTALLFLGLVTALGGCAVPIPYFTAPEPVVSGFGREPGSLIGKSRDSVVREVGPPNAHFVNDSDGAAFFIYEKFTSQKVINLGLAFLAIGLGGGAGRGTELDYIEHVYSCILLRFGPDDRLVDYSVRNRSEDDRCSDEFASQLAGTRNLPAETQHVTNEAITLLPVGHDAELWAATQYARCLRTELEIRVTPKPKIMDAAGFQDAMFPWFESDRAPRTAKELSTLLSRPVVRQRIASLNVRYLINIAGVREVSAGLRGMHLNVVVWDIVSGDQAGKLSATSSGTSVVPAFIIPLPFEYGACDALAADLGQLLYDMTNPKTSDL